MKTNRWLVAAVVILGIALAAESIYLFRVRNANAGDKEPPYRVTSPAARSIYGGALPAQTRSQSNPLTSRTFAPLNDPFSNSGFDSYDPFQEMDQIQQMMNRMFRDSFSRGAIGRGMARQNFYEPALDVEDTKTAYLIRLDLPGIDKDKINVKIQNNLLTVSGERKSEKEETQENGNFYRMERNFGSFMRSFPIPADADSNTMTAENKNGVLTIRLPKLKNATTAPEKNIAVQ
jgi:HSP20 family protein